jgi:hypothetical protein
MDVQKHGDAFTEQDWTRLQKIGESITYSFSLPLLILFLTQLRETLALRKLVPLASVGRIYFLKSFVNAGFMFSQAFIAYFPSRIVHSYHLKV